MFELKMVTYRGIYKEMPAASINVPTPDGRRGLLPNHMAIVMPVSIGIIDVVDDQNHTWHFTTGAGVLYFEKNNAVLLSDVIEDVEHIDLDRAKAAAERAQQRLSQQMNEADMRRSRAALERAANRIKAASRKH